jgi:4-amino-4-deoxy-L-arabinose transferase-like glycosyltransferase
MNTKLFYLLLAVIILAGLLLSYVLYSGPFYTYDDLAYIMFSHQVLTGTFNPVQSPYAYGFLLPISLAASFDIFGVNTFASILPSLAEYITLILVSFAIARKLYGRNAGLFSAFFVATAPFVVGYSTRVLPDMGVGALAGISTSFPAHLPP